MLDKVSAKERVSRRLVEVSPPDDRWVVLDEHTIERPFGWVFFYNSEKFLTTGMPMYRLAGNGPVLVNKTTESVEFFGSTPSLEVIPEKYERALEGNFPG
jgi:hypothetical protein